jgi:6-pyruvoyltetrahydropterin/6-carboxytetrahydropterin synthase
VRVPANPRTKAGPAPAPNLYVVEKCYGHDRGLSCCFRQWRAESHCRFLHGYSLAITIGFACPTLDARNWVVDFGGFSDLRDTIEGLFDHKTIVAADDPERATFEHMASIGMIDVLMLQEGVSCEIFASTVYHFALRWLARETISPEFGVHRGRAKLPYIAHVRVAEHPGNSATFIPGDPQGNLRQYQQDVMKEMQ